MVPKPHGSPNYPPLYYLALGYPLSNAYVRIVKANKGGNLRGVGTGGVVEPMKTML